jgi:hypothetical protein
MWPAPAITAIVFGSVSVSGMATDGACVAFASAAERVIGAGGVKKPLFRVTDS